MQNNSLVNKSCRCGSVMTIHMHTLIHRMKVKITNVPVYTCRECARYEPLPSIKRDLVKLIGELGEFPDRRHCSFADRNEWAHVLKETFAIFEAGGLPELEEAIQKAMQDRIDLLLDLYRFAGLCADQRWMEETEIRLSQLVLESAERAI